MNTGKINATIRHSRIAYIDEKRYVARTVTYSRIDTATILERAADNSGIDRGVLSYAFYSIMKTFKNFLFNGHVVELGPLGTFRVSFSCPAAKEIEDCTPNGITCRRVIYNLSKELKRDLNDVEFEFIPAEEYEQRMNSDEEDFPTPADGDGGGDYEENASEESEEVGEEVDETAEEASDVGSNGIVTAETSTPVGQSATSYAQYAYQDTLYNYSWSLGYCAPETGLLASGDGGEREILDG